MRTGLILELHTRMKGQMTGSDSPVATTPTLSPASEPRPMGQAPSTPNRAPWLRVFFTIVSTGSMLLGVFAFSPLNGEAPTWVAGSRLEHQLASHTAFQLVDSPLRDGLRHVATAQGVCVFLDRRIDPGIPINLSVSGTRLDDGLRQIAHRAGAEMCQVDSVIYIAPPPVASKLSTLAAVKRQEAKQQPPGFQRRFFRKSRWHWNHLATPRDLTRELLLELQVSLLNEELIPHDLWPATNLPPLTAVDRLSILLAGFNLTFTIEEAAQAIRIVPFPDTVTLELTYPLQMISEKIRPLLASRFPTLSIVRHPDVLLISGTWEEHHQLKRLLAGRTSRPDDRLQEGQQAYTLHVKASARKLLATVSTQLGLEVEIDPSITEELDQHITVEVTQVSADELLQAILAPIGLDYRLNQPLLTIFPRTDR